MEDEKNPDFMTTRQTPESESERYTNGRDELNLADFPISVLQWQQPTDAKGQQVQRAVYNSTRYDPVSRRRVPQQVTLSSEEGLPTAADEKVVLALLYLSKTTNDFTEPKVHFYPHQLFQIIGWSPNSRNYDRLRMVLRRLKALTLRYENAWWDAEGREYEEEFATGIIASYRIARLTRGRKKDADVPPSWLQWHPDFFKSLAAGNLKKLDLEQLFALRLPIAQRMYRFLDKRFYTSSTVELDLRDFACGHIGLTKTANVALLKQRLAPAIAELEQVGFIAPADPDARYRKVRPGIWRVRFERAGKLPELREPIPAPPQPTAETVPLTPEFELVAGFYRSWTPEGGMEPTEAELAQARELIARHGPAEAPALLPAVITQMREQFPLAKRFGASLPYFAEAAQQQATRKQRRQRVDEETRRRQTERQETERRQAEDQAFEARWLPVWESLPVPQREEIHATVLKAHPYLASPKLRHSHLATRFCLEELVRRAETPAADVADSRQTAQ